MTDYSKNREEFWRDQNQTYYKTNTSRVSRDFMSEFVIEHNIQSVLELGCNSGGNLLAIARDAPEIELVGLDICADAINYGKTVEKNPADLRVGSIYDLSQFADDSFELVFTRGVLLHINEAQTPNVIKEMVRISSKWVWHLERHGIERVDSCPGGIPHAFSHDYRKIYEDLGFKPTIRPARTFTGTEAKGGAEHWIMVDKGDKK